MKVTSKKSIRFNKLDWGINKGCEIELPKDEETQKIILKHPLIIKVKKSEKPIEEKEDEEVEEIKRNK